MKKYKILIANDDGINADGIIALAHEVSKVADVIVVAPDRERSAASHSITVHSAIKFQKADFPDNIEAYAVSGTPADCVKFGLLNIVKDADAVISGINKGSNVGSAVMYSGTVSAALQGAFLGRRAIAVSQADYAGGKYYTEAARFIAGNLENLFSLKIPHNSIINVNYPMRGNISGVKYCTMGTQDHLDIYVKDKDDGSSYWLSGEADMRKNKPGTDVSDMEDGYITITPVTFDMTDYASLKAMKKSGVKWQI